MIYLILLAVIVGLVSGWLVYSEFLYCYSHEDRSYPFKHKDDRPCAYVFVCRRCGVRGVDPKEGGWEPHWECKALFRGIGNG